MTLIERLNGAKLVQYDKENELVFAWFGGHGVHVFNATGREVDFFQTDGFIHDDVPESEIIAAIKEKQAEYLEAEQ